MGLNMASSKKIQIYGKTYNLKSSSLNVDPEELAIYVDSKMKELANTRSKSSTLDLAMLAALNIAQELLELRSQIEAKGIAEDEKIHQLVIAIDKELQGIVK
jgi:cell division protein ZapA (FtsZ GTPase activity inhibitor)